MKLKLDSTVLNIITLVTLPCILGSTTPKSTPLPEQPVGKSAELSPTAKVVEVFVWSGPDVFRYHKQRLALSRSATDAFLRSWEKVLIREADLLFRNFNSVDLRLYYAGGGAIPNLNVAWYRQNIDGDIIDSKGALTALETYFVDLQSAGDIPVADFIVVLTRQNLAEDISGTNSVIVADAVRNSICRRTNGSAIGLVEVSSPRFLKGIAQSILFGFGLVYREVDIYKVMSSNVELAIPGASRADRWMLDSRSEDDLALRVNTRVDECLNEQQPGFDFPDFLSVQTYGATYDLNEQCSILFGSGSSSCDIRESRLCFDGQGCIDPADGTCTKELLAGDRTTCATNTGCRYGFCTFQENTTPAPPTTTPLPTTTAPLTTTEAQRASTTTSPAIDDCCCERRPLGKVVVRAEYIPC